MTEWAFKLTSPHINANKRMHWSERHRMTQALKQEVAMWCRIKKVPDLTGSCHTQLVYHPATRNAPDPDNLWPTDKACVDGLQAAGVLADDRQGCVRRSVPIIGSVRPVPARGTLEPVFRLLFVVSDRAFEETRFTVADTRR